MRVYFGNAPEGQAQAPVPDGWQQTSGFGAKQVQNYGLLVSVAGMLLVAILLQGAFRPGSIWGALLVMIVTVPLHELIHALTTPGWGLSDRTVIAFQSGKGLLLPYMVYDGSQPLWRMLLTGLAPVMLLTVLPVIFILFTPLSGAFRADLGFLAFFNIAISGGDLVNCFWLLSHLPLHATVQSRGWGLLWKV
jgi:hypothetical protein